MRVLLFHLSDLFYPTGTAVIYRRVLGPLAGEHEIHHAFAAPRSHTDRGQLPLARLRERYQDEAGGIRPVNLGGGRALPAFTGAMSKLTGREWLIFPAMFYALRLRLLLARLRPDLLWWSADYMHFSLKILDLLRHALGDGTPLHLSVYDPPGFWGGTGKTQYYYLRAVQAAGSIDVIGENLRAEVAARAAAGTPSSILNDYVDSAPVPRPAPPPDPLRVVVTGQIFGVPEMQRLLELLGSSPWETRVEWYGGANNYKVIDQLLPPRGVTLARMGNLPREQIAAAIAAAHCGYFNMPLENADFCRYSIPTKLVTYLEAALPVVFHAPAFAEVSQMNVRFRFGINLSEAVDVAAALRDFLERRAEFQAGARRAIEARYERANVLAAARTILQGAPRR